MKSKDTKTISDCTLILKSGATDLRRQERALTDIIEQHYPDGIKDNVYYGFSNKSKTTIKLLKNNPDTGTVLVKLKHNGRYSWPEYQEKGENGYTVTLTGVKKRDFLNKLGIGRVYE